MYDAKGHQTESGALWNLGEKQQIGSRREPKVNFIAFSVFPMTDQALGDPQREVRMRVLWVIYIQSLARFQDRHKEAYDE